MRAQVDRVPFHGLLLIDKTAFPPEKDVRGSQWTPAVTTAGPSRSETQNTAADTGILNFPRANQNHIQVSSSKSEHTRNLNLNLNTIPSPPPRSTQAARL